jgi:hypothetical protein
MATIQNLSFIPTQISGCSLWLDAGTPSTYQVSAGGITSITDRSANNISVSISSVKPTYISNFQNGRAGFSFTNSQWFRGNFPSTYTGTGLCCFAVATLNNSSQAYGRLLSLSEPGYLDYNTGTGHIGPFQRNNVGLGMISYRPTNIASVSLPAYDSAFIVVSEVNGVTNNMYANGTAGTGIASSGNFSISNFGIGYFADYGGTSEIGYYYGIVGEIIVYLATLTVAQRQQVEGYLAWKWGLQASLPTSHPYYYIAPNSQNLGYPSNLRIPVQVQSFLPSAAPLVFFNPKTVSGIQLWLDGNDSSSMAFSGSNITTWIDKSGNGNNATATGTPTLGNTINGIQSVVAGSGNYFNGAVTISSTTLTCFAVALTTAAQPKSIDRDQRLVSLVNTSNVDYGRTDSTIALFNQAGTSTIATYRVTGPLASNNIVQNVAFMTVSQYDGTNANLWFNGSAGTLASSASSGSFAITKYGIGNQANPQLEYWLGSIGEVILYNTSLTTAQRQQVEGYLAWKWGLRSSLPSNHPYKNTPPGLPVTASIPTFFLQPASFSPKNISGIQVWLDATDPIANGTAPANGTTISTWFDKSGTANNATGGAATYQTNVLSTNPGITFSGSTSYSLTSPGNLSTGQSQGSSLFVIFKSTTNKVDQGIFGQSPSNPFACDKTGRILYVDTTATSLVYGTMYCGFAGTSTTYTTNQIAIVSDIYTNTGVGNYTHTSFINGSNFNSTNATVTGANTSSFIAQIGALNVASTFFTGNIFEIIYYNTTLTTLQRQSIEGYLAWKWGLQGNLPSNHPFKKFPPPPN